MSFRPPLPPPDCEPTDGPPRPIVLTAAGLAFGIGLTLAASAWVYRSHGTTLPATATRPPEFFFEHGPDERTGIESDRDEQDWLARERLESYGWVDRKAGIVRIPIDRAMQQLVRETAAGIRGKLP